MRGFSLLAVLLSVGAGLPAQQVVRGQWEVPDITSVGCPVSFGASLSARAIAHSARDGGEQDQNSKLVELRFGRSDALAVVGAQVVIHGLAENARVLPVAGAPKGELSQTFQLKAVSDSSGLTEHDVWVSKMIVRWAEVTELRYADGSVWRPSKGAYCRSVPSMYQPVNAEAH
jgi:hypothetical protein